MKKIDLRHQVSTLVLIYMFLACFGGCPKPTPAPSPNTAAEITSFAFTNPPAAASINEADHAVSVTLPYGTAINALVPTIAVSAGATVFPASGAAEDFTNPLIYTVTAQDKVTTREYAVTVKVAPDPSALLYDDFNVTPVDSRNWNIPTWRSSTDGTFVGQTQFRCSQNAPLPDSKDSCAIIALDNYNPTGHSFYGTDLISDKTFDAGISVTVRAKMDAPLPAGIICGIFLYAAPASSVNTLHDEIDFELLGNDPSQVWTNIYGHESLGTGHPAHYPYASGTAENFHDYKILWLPNKVSWYVDDKSDQDSYDPIANPGRTYESASEYLVPAAEFLDAYDPNLDWTNSPGSEQTYTASIDSVTVLQAGS